MFGPAGRATAVCAPEYRVAFLALFGLLLLWVSCTEVLLFLLLLFVQSVWVFVLLAVCWFDGRECTVGSAP
jgi:hypothetical protein